MKPVHPLSTASASKHFSLNLLPTQDDDNMLLGVFWHPFLNSSVIVQFVYTPVQFICASNIYCFINKDLGLATYTCFFFFFFYFLLFFFYFILSVQMVTKMSLNTLGFGNSRQTCQCLRCMRLPNWCRHVRSQFTISMNSCFLVLVLKLETKESSIIEAYKSNLEGRPSKWKGNLSHSLTGFRFCCCCISYNLSILISTYWKPKPLKKN